MCKKICLFLLLIMLFGLSSCVTWTNDYPDTYDDYTYKEITFEEAKAIWNSYDLINKRAKTATVYVNSPERTRVFHNCKIIGDSYYRYEIEIIRLVYNATINLDELPDGTTIFQSEQNPDIIKFNFSHGYFNTALYEKGWIVEARKIEKGVPNPDHEYDYFEYN